ncbi:MAG: amidohydrolase family protein [Traorella sp.]
MKYALVNGIILDGTKDMLPKYHQTIFVKDGLIEKIVDENTSLEGYEIIDLKGMYIMPGLINMHVHLPSSGKPQKHPTDPKKLVKLVTSNALFRKMGMKLCEKYALMELYSGVTTIRTVGGVADFDTQIRNKINNDQLLGPRILASNMAISVENGHMAGSLAYVANSASEASDYVEKIAQDNVDIIKLMITGGVLDATKKGEPGELKMSSEYVKAACDSAHALGLKVSSHTESSLGVKVALENGVDTIEHGAKLDDELVSLFKKRKASLIATLSPALPFAFFDRSISHASEVEQYNGKVVFDGIVEAAKTCLENDILVGLGTDTGCPYVTHYDMYRELNYYHKYCGVSNSFALHTATLLNAKIAGIDSITGSIETNKSADMIITKNNPLDDLKALAHVEKVIMKGKIITPKLKKIPQVEKELDKYL